MTQLPFTAYLQTCMISATGALVGTEVMFDVMAGNGPQGLSLWGLDLLIVPASIITWLILIHFFNWKSPWQAAIIGAFSPIVGCGVGVLFAGVGLLWLMFVLRYYYIAAPCGTAVSLILFYTQRHHMRRPRGFEVKLNRKEPDIELLGDVARGQEERH